VENYPDLEVSETDLTGSGLKNTVSGSKELRDDDPKAKPTPRRPRSPPTPPP
jgi:hypothetical protein